jgi:hypothetical protein
VAASSTPRKGLLSSPPSGRWSLATRRSRRGPLFRRYCGHCLGGFYRWLSENGFRPHQMMPRALWKWGISLPRVADLRTAPQLKRMGLDVPPPGRSSWPPYQSAGESLHTDGWPALIAPSAARPDAGTVLCVFRDTERPPGIAPIPPPRVFRKPPAPPTGMRT